MPAQVKHTWHPSGKYEKIKTPIPKEDVVPIRLDDVRSPSPLAVVEEEKEEEPLQEKASLEFSSSLPPFANGDSAAINIPDGIPLLARIFPNNEESYKGVIPLERIFTPANDYEGFAQKKKKMFSSSDFYAPDHPTIDDQLRMAHRISDSLLAASNSKSKGQEMYARRKEKLGTLGTDVEQSETMELKSTTSKSALKLVLSSSTVHDQHSMYATTLQHGLTPSTLGDFAVGKIGDVQKIGDDLNSPTGRGAELFAQRKKLMDKFIVDETHVERSVYQPEQHLSQMSSKRPQEGGTVYTAEVKLLQASRPDPGVSQFDNSSSLMESDTKQTSNSNVTQNAFSPIPTAGQQEVQEIVNPHKLAKYDADVADDKNKLYNFNFAASGFGTYRKFYRPISFVVTKY